MERTSTNRRRSNRTGIEENTLAIVESTEAKDTQDADDDSTSLSIPSFLFVSPETLNKIKEILLRFDLTYLRRYKCEVVTCYFIRISFKIYSNPFNHAFQIRDFFS